MKKLIKVLSYIGLALATFLLITLYSGSFTKQSIALESFPLNKTQVINFQVDESIFNQLTEREKKEQLRDWLLLTLTSDSSFSPSTINQSLYDLPPIRHGYLKPVSNFEYSDTRSLYIGNGRVIALLPKENSAQEKIDRIAHIADKHRQNLGKIPENIEIFEYEINLAQSSANLIPIKIVRGENIFSEKQYGYTETEIKTLNDLEKFLSRIDDITFAKTNGSNLILGGRKIHSYPYIGIKVEDIAALWQSEQKIEGKLQQWRSRWEARLNALPLGTSQTTVSQLQREAFEERQKLKLVDGSGFSLDPSYDYRGLAKDFSKIKPFLQTRTFPEITAKDLQEAELGMKERNEVPYLILTDKLSKSQNYLTASIGNQLFFLGEKYRLQSARYDGELQGTEVGMVLFYTDLLAKLWALDYLETTPEKYISDFQPLTERTATASSIYKQEMEELSSTRLWFGTQDKGFQVAENGDSLLFARNSTRIYAASSNSLNPGKETTAAANSEAFLGWWNDHYEEVARYEPQYEKLNEIMKWSLLVSWLNQADKDHLLTFLENLQVKHHYRFPNWVQANKQQLKFKNWDAKSCQSQLKTTSQQSVCFHPQGYKGTTTETMPILWSKPFEKFGRSIYFGGGVSLANKNIFQKRASLPRSTDVSDLSLRSHLDYSSVKLQANTLSFQTVEETYYQLIDLNPSSASSTVKAKPGTKFRSPEAELANLELTRNVSRTTDGIKIDTTVAGVDLGRFQSDRTKNGFTVGWRSRDTDIRQSLVAELSRSSQTPVDFLRSHPQVQAIAQSTDSSVYYIRMEGSERWFKLAQGGGSGNIPPGWDSRIGFPDDPKNPFGFPSRKNDNSYLVAWLDGKRAEKLLDEGKAQYVWSRTEKKGDSAQEFIRNLENENYRNAAQKLINEPQAFYQFQKQYYQKSIKNVDESLKKGKFANAEQTIASLIEIYGQKPDLMVRKAIVAIQQGKLNVQPVSFGQGKFDQGARNFLDEINGMPGQAKFKGIKKDDALIYVHDTPGLNNIDWNQPIEASLPFTNPKTRVYKLKNGNIGAFTLEDLGYSDKSAFFGLSNDYEIHQGSFRLRSSMSSDEQCEENIEGQCPTDDPNQPDVYIIFDADEDV